MADSIINYEITLDMQDKISNKCLNVRYGDVGNKITATIIDGGSVVPFPGDTRLVFAAIKPDGKTLYDDNCTITSHESNTVEYTLPEQATNVIGITTGQFVIYRGLNRIATTPAFRLDVQSRTVAPGEEIQTSDDFVSIIQTFDAIQSLLSYLETAPTLDNALFASISVYSDESEDVPDSTKLKNYDMPRWVADVSGPYQFSPTIGYAFGFHTGAAKAEKTQFMLTPAGIKFRSKPYYATDYPIDEQTGQYIWKTFLTDADIGDTFATKEYVDGAIENIDTYSKAQIDSKVNTRELVSNKTASLSSSSTDDQYPTAKCVYDMIGNIESLLAEV